MNKKLRRQDESLLRNNSFNWLRSSAKRVTVLVLFVMALILLASSPSLAQGNKHSRKKPSTKKAQPQRVEGVVISGNRLTIKPGYEFELVPSATVDWVVKVKLKGGANVTEATCSCVKKTPQGGSSCNVAQSPKYLSCQQGTGELPGEKGCNQCKRVNVKQTN